MKENKFYVFNAGYIRRGKDTIWIQKYLETNGWELVMSPKKASLLIISTCGVVQENEDKSSPKRREKAPRL
jgi:tRNA A37 methylthiotransferase MiaB